MRGETLVHSKRQCEKSIGLLVSVDGGHGVVRLAPGEDPGVGTLEDGGQAPPDKAEGPKPLYWPIVEHKK